MHGCEILTILSKIVFSTVGSRVTYVSFSEISILTHLVLIALVGYTSMTLKSKVYKHRHRHKCMTLPRNMTLYHIITHFGFKIRFICGAVAFVISSTTPNPYVGCTTMVKCLQYVPSQQDVHPCWHTSALLQLKCSHCYLMK